jgi:hypothetical protein
MRILDPWYDVWSDAEVCDLIRKLHRQQAHRVATLARGDQSVCRAHAPRACDQEITCIANFSSGLQYFAPAAQKPEHVLALQERLRPLFEAGQLSPWQFLFICNHRPERLPVLERCLEAGAQVFGGTESESLEAKASKTPQSIISRETARFVLEAVIECLPPGTNCEEIDADGNYLPVDASLAQPFAYAWWLGESRTRLDAEMEQLERSRQRRVRDSFVDAPERDPSVMALKGSMQRARALAEEQSLVEQAEAFAGVDLLGPQPVSFENICDNIGGTTLSSSRRESPYRRFVKLGSSSDRGQIFPRERGNQSLEAMQELRQGPDAFEGMHAADYSS